MQHPIAKISIGLAAAFVAWAGITLVDVSRTTATHNIKIEALERIPDKLDAIVESTHQIKVDVARIEERTRRADQQ